MANIVKTYSFVNSQPADGTQVNKNFDDVIAGVGDLTTLRPTVASLGLDADITSLSLPVNTTISAAGAELVNDADAAAQIATLGAAAASHTHVLAAGATDVTATVAELNTLDGITPTVTELNYVDGVTSAIQTQLNAKKAITTGSFVADGFAETTVTHGLGTTPSFVLATSVVGKTLYETNTITSTTFKAQSISGGTTTVKWIAVA